MCPFSHRFSTLGRNYFSLWNIRLAPEAILTVLSSDQLFFRNVSQEFAFSLIRGVLSSCVCKELSKKETGFSSQKLRLFLPAHIALHHSGVSNLFFLRKLFRTLSIYFVTSLATYHVRVVSNSGPFHTSVFMLSFWGHLFCPSLLLSVSNEPYALQHTYTNADLQEVRYLQRGCTIATNSLSGTLKICTFGYMSVIPP